MSKLLDKLIPPYALERLIKLAKERLRQQGREINSLDVYRQVAKLRREELRRYYNTQGASGLPPDRSQTKGDDDGN